eukprot:COSAG02_NODE_5273_length_4480_cov_1.606026_3_plen_47_part_00
MHAREPGARVSRLMCCLNEHTGVQLRTIPLVLEVVVRVRAGSSRSG